MIESLIFYLWLKELLRSMLPTLEENILDDLGKCYTGNVIKHVKSQFEKKIA